ncbi:hypothetical protein D9M72_480080 [compost metagenome]
MDVRDVDDGFLRRVQHLHDGVQIPACVEEIADVQPLQVGVAVELFVVGIGHCLEPRLVFGRQHCHGVAAEVRAGHGHHVDLVASDELAQLATQLVVRVAADVVELVDGDETTVEGLDAELVHCEPECGVRAHQHRVVAGQECAHGLDLGRRDLAVVLAGSVAQVPLRAHNPVGPEAVLGELFIGKAAADGALGHNDDRLLQPLVLDLVQGNKHQCPGLARRRRRLDEQVLLAALGISTLLHRPHAQGIDLAGCPRARRRNGDRGDCVLVGRIFRRAHVLFCPLGMPSRTIWGLQPLPA